MKLSKSNQLLITAFNKGYDIDKKGVVYGVKGNPISLVSGKGKEGRLKKYYHFTIRDKDGKCRRIAVHRFQAFKKFGNDVFKNGIQVRHLNNDAGDNSWENIDIGTQSQNLLDLPKEQRRKMASSPKYNHFEIIKDYHNGMNYSDIMVKHNVKNRSTVSYIINKSLQSEEVELVHSEVS